MGLTTKEIENAKPGSKSYKLADGGGLCCSSRRPAQDSGVGTIASMVRRR
jgi:hypothetical protein